MRTRRSELLLCVNMDHKHKHQEKFRLGLFKQSHFCLLSYIQEDTRDLQIYLFHDIDFNQETDDKCGGINNSKQTKKRRQNGLRTNHTATKTQSQEMRGTQSLDLVISAHAEYHHRSNEEQRPPTTRFCVNVRIAA